jgi:hypothetical protein
MYIHGDAGAERDAIRERRDTIEREGDLTVMMANDHKLSISHEMY